MYGTCNQQLLQELSLLVRGFIVKIYFPRLIKGNDIIVSNFNIDDLYIVLVDF